MLGGLASAAVDRSSQQLLDGGMARTSIKRRAGSIGSVLTIDELASYLKIAKSTLYKLSQEGKVPGQKVGRHWRFRKETIDRWLDENREEQR